ncbi:MAG: D-Ala-D-Ala carboxypeptidase family metallohydrolase [Jaaginema sp. PMC 1079.18]|nr:D-Ala-D-Ala carboxypeptidase family metallohydrolase [Jaaginema sp. PMC 1080.18]MEC4852413.1 D-Ala-D-Ala carboxypeptidase family metallohydrolase [Jaaginema sp. PMC 1079.18]MEC4867263.1 D-Ala-D-Ala carboxypeptidase family metallohydrolase [Jaaginema sp. PMC 1078.18]
MVLDFRLTTLQPEYEKAFLSCGLRKDKENAVREIADTMLSLRQHYEAVEQATGIPWWFSGVIHYREWNFREPDLFVRQVTDILLAKNYHQAKTRTLGAYLWGLDLWNGFRSGIGDESEWIWAGTNVLESSSDQIGVAAIIHYLQAHNHIDIPKPGAGIALKVVSDTVFKHKPTQSFRLTDTEKMTVKAGTRLQVLEDEPSEEGHVKIVLPDGVLLGQNNHAEWYVFKEHIAVQGTEPGNKPKDPPEEPETKIASENKGSPITVPKLGTVYLGNPVIEGGHFSWAEVTKNGSRIPANAEVVDGVLRVAEVMEEVREYMGKKPITINSWYRDPVSNRRVGGASRSRHLVGDAVDFVVQGVPPSQTHQRLESWWGNRGGIASASSFTHLDVRGYRARWSYGF